MHRTNPSRERPESISIALRQCKLHHDEPTTRIGGRVAPLTSECLGGLDQVSGARKRLTSRARVAESGPPIFRVIARF